MLQKILVPLDGSELATAVLPHIVAIAQALQSSITLLRVLDSAAQVGAINPVDWQLHKIEVQSYLDALGLRLAQCMDCQPSQQTLEGPAANRILEYAQKHDFDLLALCSHGQGGLSGWNISNVAQKVIDRARKSILLVRGYQPHQEPMQQDWCAFRYRRILVALDGSQRAEHVLPVATALAHHFEAELLLAHVVSKPQMIERMPLSSEDNRLSEQMIERNRTQATRYFDELQTRLSPKPQLHVLDSDSVAPSLHALVEEQAVDLVVLSAHGYACQQKWPYGTITSSFISYGSTPLLILQDLPAHEILFSQAERLSEQPQISTNGGTNGVARHASAEWGNTNVALAS